ncbi:polyketide synthase dehydratase domain-containing protein, partial [Salmonella enterica]|nr:polyketide synthase dehydratase domain-containing protein [Salmonella enterica]
AVSHAFHSAQMEPMLGAFRAVAESVSYRRPSLPVVSNVTGALADESLCTAAYWVEHVMRTVRFADGVRTLAEAGVKVFTELGPQGTLLGMVAETLGDEAEGVSLTASLKRGRKEEEAVLEALGAQHVGGAAVKWAGVFRGDERKVSLPLYPWQRERYWLEAVPKALAGEETGHPLLGRRISLAGEGAVYESRITPATHGWLYDHVFGGQPIMPGTAWAEIIRAAGCHYFTTNSSEVSSLMIRAPLVMSHEGFKIQTYVKERGEFYEVVIYSRVLNTKKQPKWELHASAEIHPTAITVPLERETLETTQTYVAINTDAAYAGFTLLGMEYRSGFRCVTQVASNGRYTLAEVALPEDVIESGYGGHPVLLDSAIQALWAKQSAEIFQLSGAGQKISTDGYLLFSIDSYVVRRPNVRRAKVAIAMREKDKNDNGLVYDVCFYDEMGEVAIEITGLRERAISYDTLKNKAVENAAVYRTCWQRAQE